jgi:hypothetical protein
MMSKTFQFPVWLSGTKEEQAAEEQRQSLMRASFTRAHLTEAERLVGRGALLEQTAIGNLATPNDLARSQYADALAMQGQYQLAAEIHPGAERRKYFESIINAIEMPDLEKCDCPDSAIKVGDLDLAITPRFESTRIFSSVHGDLVSLVVCQKCGHANARPLRSRLLPMNAALNQSEQAKRPVLSDAQVLNATA